ncbi:hypothetical protein [Phenylobacterium sp.]
MAHQIRRILQSHREGEATDS